MNKAIKAKWLEALKSGKYRKTVRRLRAKQNKNYGYCCLGVLCDLYRKETGKGEWSSNNLFEIKEEGHTSHSYGLLPAQVMKWSRISDIEGSFSTNQSLVTLNDETKGFKEVIKAIEKHF